jgi:hypothetical protein
MEVRIARICTNEHHAPATQEGVQLLGVEMEAEHVPESFANGVRFIDGWRGVGDGSLRQRGLEFITPPVTRQTAEGSLHRFYAAKAEFKFRSSIRTSMHVHVDVRRDTYASLSGILASYLVVEPLLMALCGPLREESIFCVPFYRAPSPLKVVRRALGEMRAPQWGKITKYSALNLGSIPRLGTIEFRHAPLWRRCDQAIRWVGIVERIVTYGREYTAAAVLDACTERGVALVANEILGGMVDTVRLMPTPVDAYMDEYNIAENIGLLYADARKGTENFTWHFLRMKPTRAPLSEERITPAGANELVSRRRGAVSDIAVESSMEQIQRLRELSRRAMMPPPVVTGPLTEFLQDTLGLPTGPRPTIQMAPRSPTPHENDESELEEMDELYLDDDGYEEVDDEPNDTS